ncbi:hypothetical protein A3A76_04830 [Candidatus Woesebacteria bacterium RIFCSPLOWO2_01_FULL_39_23]|uniref:Uncharacterized protein n=2 Tax=Microgenomates group TaxID=1794810 RepID=A0A0H4T3I9_9BACT|nr:hypothetical protein [uncultured Microgenomates bacterium Rifle_16ft_4_minimus_37633]OGM13807.1 MAG: hypothetical protein A2141_04055 [Candidatus Woesebacteria bacterium RBG_16_40_11]OGM27757.1 MAG: hypothetical protein A2628_05050 [Candidatus Woesebacteria bacterium RIFCSPHIGHO2_01_FULL_40_22]OGM36023.1 MAG: hypothetical protein A3E41_01305 [Candidatus Woesebacteria bacterium RIFCSPHIGHO2_12_FULL_38_9]OGM62179.1 MAG: hypothetical protein A3A76_04830 [Candidatus Woesebacteria bacterium RIFCS
MAPSANDLATSIGRPLKEGDILVGENTYEVVGFGERESGVFRRKKRPRLQLKIIIDKIPGKTIYSINPNDDMWDSVVCKEDRNK